MDPLAVHLAMTEAVEHMRRGRGPTVVEVDTYRFFHQNGGFAGSAFGYRDKEEERSWRARDPLKQTAAHLERRGLMTAEETAEAVTAAKAVMEEIGDVLLEPTPTASPASAGSGRPSGPTPPGSTSACAATCPSSTAPARRAAGPPYRVQETKFIDAVAAVMGRRMETDARHRRDGRGRAPAQRRHQRRHPRPAGPLPGPGPRHPDQRERLRRPGRRHRARRPVTGRSSSSCTPTSCGSPPTSCSTRSARPGTCTAAPARVPLVLRSKVAMGTGYGSQHSMDPAGIFATAPGWRIVAPSTPYDYVGLMNAALRCQDPVVVLEHVDLYTSTGPGPVDDLDYCLPVGKAAVRRTGSDVTVLTYLAMMPYVLDAVEEHGVDAEVIDLRWLDRASIDWDTIEERSRKTNQVLIAEQGALGTSYGGWLADEIQRRFFDLLDAPVRRVTGGEASPSISKVLERAAIAQTRRGRRRARRDREVLTGPPAADARGRRQRHRGGARGVAGRRDRASPPATRSPRSRPRRPSSTSRPRRRRRADARWCRPAPGRGRRPDRRPRRARRGGRRPRRPARRARRGRAGGRAASPSAATCRSPARQPSTRGSGAPLAETPAAADVPVDAGERTAGSSPARSPASWPRTAGLAVEEIAGTGSARPDPAPRRRAPPSLPAPPRGGARAAGAAAPSPAVRRRPAAPSERRAALAACGGRSPPGCTRASARRRTSTCARPSAPTRCWRCARSSTPAPSADLRQRPGRQGRRRAPTCGCRR